MEATADRQAVAGAGVLGRTKQLDQIGDVAEIRSVGIDPAAARAGVEVNAPAIGAHHGQVFLLLCWAESVDGLLPQARIQAAAGPATADAAPLLLLLHLPLRLSRPVLMVWAGGVARHRSVATADYSATGQQQPSPERRCDKPSQSQAAALAERHLRLTCNHSVCCFSAATIMGIDFHLIANFAALALITLAGPAVIFVLFYRRGAL